MKAHKFLTGTLFAAALVASIAGMVHLLRYERYAAMLEIPPCFRIGGSMHHMFEPGCSGVSPITGIKYSINEIGLRERPVSGLGRGGVLILGDSIVEGKGLAFPDVISQRLEAEIGRVVINGGIRSRGPVSESAHLDELLKAFSPELVVWVLNENDADDDRLAAALAREYDPQGVPSRLGTDDFDAVAAISHWREKLGPLKSLLNAVLYRSYQNAVSELMNRETKLNVCAGIERGIRKLGQSNTRLLFVLTPLGPFNTYPGMVQSFKALEPCLAGKEVLDFRAELTGNPAAFLPDDTHLSPLGTRWLAARLKAPVLAALQARSRR